MMKLSSRLGMANFGCLLISLVAWRLMWLARLSDNDKLAPCDTVLKRIEWTRLSRKMNKTRKSQGSVTTVEQAFLWIAKLGGYIARPSDPDTGVISL